MVVVFSMKLLANLFLSLAKGFASLSGRELSAIIGRTDFRVEFRKATDTDNYSWEQFYDSGNIFFEGFANPVKIDPPKLNESLNEDNFSPSEKYRMGMQMNLLSQAFDTHGKGLDLMEKLLIANIGAVLLIGAILVVLLG